MKSIIIILIYIVPAVTNQFGQRYDNAKYKFAIEVFNSDKYQRSNINQYTNPIIVLGKGKYTFGKRFLNLAQEDSQYHKLFTLGIFNPDIIFGSTTTIFSKQALEQMSSTQKAIFNFLRNDSLSLCCFESLDKINPNAQTKRLKFWVFSKGAINPTEYYLELYNDKATKETLLDDFLENASMTFFYRGTIII